MADYSQMQRHLAQQPAPQQQFAAPTSMYNASLPPGGLPQSQPGAPGAGKGAGGPQRKPAIQGQAPGAGKGNGGNPEINSSAMEQARLAMMNSQKPGMDISKPMPIAQTKPLNLGPTDQLQPISMPGQGALQVGGQPASGKGSSPYNPQRAAQINEQAMSEAGRLSRQASMYQQNRFGQVNDQVSNILGW